MQREAASARCVNPLPLVDVGIAQVGQVSNVLLGASAAINFDVSAFGALDAPDVVANFTLPDLVSFDAVTTTSGNCTSGAGAVSCELGTIIGQGSERVTITVTPVAVGSGTVRASVTTSGNDERFDNDQVAVQLSVDPAVDLEVNAPATSPVFIDTDTTVTVRLENLSTLAATNVSLSVTLADGLRASFASWPLGDCSVSAQQIDCEASRFDAQSSTSLSISARAVALGLQDVSASVSSAETDADTSNNRASRDVNVVEPQVENDSGGGTTGPLFLLLIALAALRRRY
jgi:MYXO-CTERM domain-containing protein